MFLLKIAIFEKSRQTAVPTRVGGTLPESLDRSQDIVLINRDLDVLYIHDCRYQKKHFSLCLNHS